MKSIKEQLQEKRSNYSLWEEELKAKRLELDASLEELAVIKETILVFQKAAKISQEALAKHLSTIVTKAIRAVVQKPYEFVCEFVERRGATEADLYLMKEGDRYELLKGTGGGIADVCSVALKVAYLLLSSNSRVLVMDEISRHINAPEQRARFAEVIKSFSTQFGIQFILITAVSELLEVSDEVIEIAQ